MIGRSERLILIAGALALLWAAAPLEGGTHRPAGIARDSHGRIARSIHAKREFEAATGYPHGRPGYVVDHVIALACGGPDVPSNMQWQTIAEGKAKDKWERIGC